MTLLSLALAARVIAAGTAAPPVTDNGTEVRVVLDQRVSTRRATIGAAVRFHVADDVMIRGRLVARGSVVMGTVIHAKRAGRIHGNADLAIGDLTILSPDGAPLARSRDVITALAPRRPPYDFYARQTADAGAILTGMVAGYGAAGLASQWSHSEETVADVGIIAGAATIALVKILPRGEDLEILPGGALTVTFTDVRGDSSARFDSHPPK